MRKALQYWLPVGVWVAIILRATGRTFDAAHTTGWIVRVLSVVGIHLSDTATYVADVFVRKTGHLTVYAILTALSFRAAREGRRGFMVRWALVALAITVCVASTDEFLQSFTPTRTSSAWDIVLDTCGGTIALLLIRLCSLSVIRYPSSEDARNRITDNDVTECAAVRRDSPAS